jgi:hypothetical protein
MQEIPFDIIAAITQHLGDDVKRETLISCNSTSRAFRKASLPHLFGSITISMDPEATFHTSPSPRQQLYNLILSPTSSISPYVQELVLVLQEGELEEKRDFIAVLSRLASIHVLRLQTDSHHKELQWRNIDADISSSIANLFMLPNLMTVGIKCLGGVPLKTLLSKSGCRSLSLESGSGGVLNFQADDDSQPLQASTF